jgi:uncharacterized protein (UPF0276 family)
MDHSAGGGPFVGLALMLEPEFARAAFPLFAAGEVEVVEWSFDTLWSGAEAPDWLLDLISEYSNEGRLLGHGVTYSMFTARDGERTTEWCQRLARECQTRRYRHVTEHFGFMVAGDFHRGAPLPVPFTREFLDLGRGRMQALADAAKVPVGLENLAFAFGEADVRRQGEFLDALLAPVDGFLLLDLHNIHCQACNFGISPEVLISAYPLERVQELHLSGGSWGESAGATVRRDTHDGPVPEELFTLLHHALKVCPNVRAVVLEQLGTALVDEESRERYTNDFRRISGLIHEFRALS